MAGISAYSGNSDRTSVIGTGLAGSVVGMSAYYLPVRKDRFVRTAYDIMREQTEEKIVKFNNAALSMTSSRLKPEQKLFLSQEGVAETLDAINTKVADLKKIILDKDYIKNVKKDFADNFDNFKNSEALRDVTSSKAFQKIRWTNFAWGAGICFVLAAVLAGGKNSKGQ